MVRFGGFHKRLRPSRVASGDAALRARVAEAKVLYDSVPKPTVEALEAAMRGHASFASWAIEFVKCVDACMHDTISFDEFMRSLEPTSTADELRVMRAWADGDESAGAAGAGPLDARQLEEIRSIFKHYDANANGLLEPHEVVEALTDSGYDSEEVEDILENYDTSRDGKLDINEFTALLTDTFYGREPAASAA